jgi:glycosyltransferase involved in cell wall biosynthesis
VRLLLVSKALVSAMYRKKLTAMCDLGAEVIAVVPPSWREGGSEQRLEVCDASGFEMIVSPLRWNGHYHLHYYPELPRAISKTRPDLVYLDEEPYNLATWHGARVASRHCIPSLFFTWQNLNRRYPPPFRALEKGVYRMASGAVAGNEESAGVLRSKGFPGDITIAPQFGVDPDVFSPGSPTETPFTVGFFNRLIPAKAPLQTLAAFARLPAHCRLRVVGDGPLRGRLGRESARLGVSDRVSLENRVASGRMPELIRSVHVVVLPSLTTKRWKEQFGRILVEAMACGVPVVGSDSGEIPHVIGDAGLIVPEGDVDALSSALVRLHDDPELCAELGRRGRERVMACFTNARVAELTYRACQLAREGGSLRAAGTV